jgi:CubicO group peptidase (beta-lactamase class C family)
MKTPLKMKFPRFSQFWIFSLMLLAAISWQACDPAIPIGPDVITTDPPKIIVETVDPAIDQVIEEEMCEQDLVGLAIGVIKDGEIVHVKGYGYADLEIEDEVDLETMFRWASMSKSLTAIAAMQAVEDDDMDLDVDIRTYVPYYPAKPEGTITLRHLLTNRSGIGHYSDIPGWSTGAANYPSDGAYDAEASVEIFKDAPLLFAPGSQYKYTSFGFNLAGAAVDEAGKDANGKGFPQRVDEGIANKLGMTSLQPDYQWINIPNSAIGYTRDCEGQLVRGGDDDVSYKLPGGGFISNIKDLTRYVCGLMEHKVLPQSTLEDIMWQPANGGSSGYGYGFNIDNQGYVWHSGAQQKTRTRFHFHPTTGNGIVIMTNSYYINNSRLMRRIYNAIGVNWSVPEYSLYDYLGCDDEDKCEDKGQTRLAGVWRVGNSDQFVRRGLTTEQFHLEWEDMADKGYKLFDIETYVHEGVRKWDGLFQKHSGGYVLLRNRTSENFSDKWKDYSKQGLRLIDIERYRLTNGDVRWAGVFIEGNGGHGLWRNASRSSFMNKAAEFYQNGLLPIDLEIDLNGNNDEVYAGIFRPGTGRYKIVDDLTTSAFNEEWSKNSGAGMRLVDVERYTNGKGQVRWAGIFHEGTGGHALQRNYDFCGFLERMDHWKNNGLELIDLEAY